MAWLLSFLFILLGVIASYSQNDMATAIELWKIAAMFTCGATVGEAIKVLANTLKKVNEK